MSDETKIGRYLVEAPIGEGAMGSVYRAVDPMIKRVVAIKKIRLDQVSTPEERNEFKQRLFQEAQISGILLHPNIVVVYDVGEEDGLPFIAMEYVEGTTLKDLMKREGPLDRRRIANIVTQVSTGLQYAHEHNIIHRDIKPHNVMVSKSGEAKIMDFGIAKFIDTHMTKTGIFLGTPAYSSPEQIKGEDVDYRSDIFSLGVLAHELLTHRPPFPGASINTILYNVAHGLPEIDDSLKGIAYGGLTLESVFLKVLEKDPRQRYQSATDFAAHFQYALGYSESASLEQLDTPGPTVPVPPPGSPGDWNRPTVRMEHSPASSAQAPPVAKQAAYDAPTIPDTQPGIKGKRGVNPWVLVASILGVVSVATIITFLILKSLQKTGPVDPDPHVIRQVVQFQSIPSNASVFLDGQEIGRTPFSREFKQEFYEFEVRLEGHETIAETLEIPLYDPNVSFTLIPIEDDEPVDDEPLDSQTEVYTEEPEDTDTTATQTTTQDEATPETLSEFQKDQRDWGVAQKANTERAYRGYLNAHPQGQYAPDARGRIVRLRVRREYQRAMKSTSETDLQAFLDRYPNSQYADDVRAKLNQLHFSKKYEAALSSNSPREIDAFLQANLHRLTDAQVAGIKSAQENLAYEKTIGSNDAAAFKRYLDVYKDTNQEHMVKIREKLDAVRVTRQAFLEGNIGFPSPKKKTRIWGKKDYLVDYELKQAPPFKLMETTVAWHLGTASEQITILRRNGPTLNGAIPNELLTSGTLSFRLILKDVDGLVYTFPAQSTQITK